MESENRLVKIIVIFVSGKNPQWMLKLVGESLIRKTKSMFSKCVFSQNAKEVFIRKEKL